MNLKFNFGLGVGESGFRQDFRSSTWLEKRGDTGRYESFLVVQPLPGVALLNTGW